jgi:F-type H+-transporting ATPase subunit b
MPQLDPAGFLTQLFWLVVTFVILCLLMWRVALPKIADLLQERQERIDGDLQRAERLKDDAAKVLENYEQAIAEGREKAQAVLRAAAERDAAEAAERNASLAERLTGEAEAAERRINAARDEALANVRAVAAEVAQAATERLIGADVPASEAAGAVDAAVKERG